MFPINDNNPTRLTPYVTYGLIAVNIVVFIHQVMLAPQQLEQFFQLYAVIPKELTAILAGIPISVPQSIPEPLTLITSQFLHGGFLHIAGNMLFLWIFGNNIEDKLGHVKYFIFYITCGILAALAQWFFSMQSGIPSLGASGAIAGVMGAYILRFPHAQIRTLVFLGPFIVFPNIPAIFFLGLWFVQQALYGIASLGVQTNVGMQSGGIAYWAHAGGFVFGALLGPLLGLFSDSRPKSF
ncbi:MAG: rhomboid family intramembrane serine protease [Symplocastrum torsivum CPER-KK1]|uniref:Rhomboid family intramembrane serine protease n=1 Tax=Symplocastrum torsivum CPER-KK1 TaxID=450513 RepID=A0A951UA81_9CYAN|nr:rhomboid family intramembrane serine protease [Symplocastrum torsivum CPER-KK1]